MGPQSSLQLAGLLPELHAGAVPTRSFPQEATLPLEHSRKGLDLGHVTASETAVVSKVGGLFLLDILSVSLGRKDFLGLQSSGA